MFSFTKKNPGSKYFFCLGLSWQFNIIFFRVTSSADIYGDKKIFLELSASSEDQNDVAIVETSFSKITDLRNLSITLTN